MINLILVLAVVSLLVVLLLLLLVVIQEHRKSRSISDRLKTVASPPRGEQLGAEPKGEPTDFTSPKPSKQPESPARSARLQPPQSAEIPPKTETQTPPPRPRRSEASEVEKVLQKSYGPYNHDRLRELGLGEDEINEFVIELIHQLEKSVDEIDEALAQKDFQRIEHITHGLKGAAVNIGEGGVAALLIDFNTYLKEHNEPDVVKAYLQRLREYLSDLKSEYSQR